MVQDDVVGHVEALPYTQVVKQGRLPKHIAHVHNCDVWKEETTVANITHKGLKVHILKAYEETLEPG